MGPGSLVGAMPPASARSYTPGMARELVPPWAPVLGIAAVVPALLDQASVDSDRAAWVLLASWALASAHATALVRAAPALSAVTAFVALGVVEVLASVLEVELTFLDLAPSVVCLAAAAALAPVRHVQLAVGVVVALVVVGTVVNRLTATREWQGGVDLLAAVAVLAGAVLAGQLFRSQREATELAVLRQNLAEQERARATQDAVAAERGRIARELHDLVAHAITLLVVHAETLRARRSDLPDWASAQADQMAGAGRRAHEELRLLLRLLSSDSGATGLPGAESVPALIAEAAAAGAPARLTEQGRRPPLSQGASLTVYRLVQEALSNARRHRPGAGDVHAVLTWAPDGVEVRVRTSGPAEAPAGPPADPSAGLGLQGLRARVAELGGTLEVDEDPDAHELRAFVPVREPVRG